MSRDRLGEIPLYWTRIQDSIYFASEIKALLEVSAQPTNEATVYPYLVDGFQHVNNETFFNNISSFPAATWSVLDQKFPTTVRRYWKAPRQRLKERDVVLREAIGQVRDTLQDAVRIRLRADVPWCMTLSGGLDSSVLVALAALCSELFAGYKRHFNPIQKEILCNHRFAIFFDNHLRRLETNPCVPLARVIGRKIKWSLLHPYLCISRAIGLRREAKYERIVGHINLPTLTHNRHSTKATLSEVLYAV